MRYLWAVAAGLILAFGLGFLDDKDDRLGNREWDLGMNQARMKKVATQLKIYRIKTGHYPSNDLGLNAIAKQYTTSDIDYACRAPYVYSGIWSTQGEPYIYENRIGHQPSDFSHSGVNTDRYQKYSLKVDRGIYIWSSAAKSQYELVAFWRPIVNYGKLLVWLLAGTCFAGFVFSCRRHISRKATDAVEATNMYVFSGMGGLILAFVTVLIFQPRHLTSGCYRPCIQQERTPEMSAEYISIMQKYRDCGVISDKAFAKLIKALEEENRQIPGYDR